MQTTIRKAVIPVAGLGTRFLPATKALPKEMLPIIDKPALQYTVEQAVAAGITDFILVTGAGKRAIEDHFDLHFELETRLRRDKKHDTLQMLHKIRQLANFIYVRQPEPLGDGHALLMAEAAVGNEPFVYLYPDEMLLGSENPVTAMLRVFSEYGAPSVGCYRVPRKDVSKYGILRAVRVRGRIYEVAAIVEKPSPATAPSRLAVTKGYVLTPDIFLYIRRLRRKRGGEIRIADAMELYNRKHAVFACELRGERFDTGSKLGWLEANVALGLERTDLRVAFRRFLRQRLHHESTF